MNINFKQLEAFIWVSDLGSFRRAAERLNTTQPNISARISSLEATLKIKLMERDAGSVRLNAKGQELLSEARSILKGVEAFIDVAGQSHRIEGVIKLGVTEMIVNTWLRDFLKQVKEQFPKLNVELMVDVSDNLRPELFSKSIDLAFQNGPFARQTSGVEDLGTYPFVWVASPDIALASHTQLTAEEMKQEPILTHARGTRPFAETEAHFQSTKGRPPTIIPSTSIAPCLHMALDGIGVACLPASMVHRDIKAGNLVQLNYPWVPTALQFLARYDAQTAHSNVGRVAKLAAQIAQDFPKTLKSEDKVF
jgi:DNA-binding transcriptional LysR family regulator